MGHWCFTYNNPKFTLDVVLNIPEVRYAIWQHEIGETGTPHLQGYLELKRSQRYEWLHNLIPGAKFLRRNGTREEARNYCKKKDETYIDGPWEVGIWTGGQGTRNDIKQFITNIKDGKTNKELIESNPTEYCKYQRMVKHIREIYAPEVAIPDINLLEWQAQLIERFKLPPVKRQIIWIWSREGKTGKTTFMDYISHHFKLLPGSWQNNDNLYAYDNHQIIYWNIARAKETHSRMWEILELWSDHTLQQSGKYESMAIRTTCHVVVTANIPPPDSNLMSPDRFLEIQVPPLELHSDANNSL